MSSISSLVKSSKVYRLVRGREFGFFQPNTPYSPVVNGPWVKLPAGTFVAIYMHGGERKLVCTFHDYRMLFAWVNADQIEVLDLAALAVGSDGAA